jgi:hypothetical protein
VITVVEACGDRFGVEPICRVLGYRSASSVYARRNHRPSARQLRDEQVLQAIGTVRIGNAACYGARRTWIALRRTGFVVARCTVERVMRQAGLIGVQRGRTAPRTTTPDATAVRPPDLVNRNFTADRPDQLWLSDLKCRRRHLMSYADRRTMPIIPVSTPVVAAAEVWKVGIVA